MHRDSPYTEIRYLLGCPRADIAATKQLTWDLRTSIRKSFYWELAVIPFSGAITHYMLDAVRNPE